MIRQTFLLAAVTFCIFSSFSLADETVSTPTMLTIYGGKFFATQPMWTNTGGSVSSEGHAVQYRFDWGDGTTSEWGTGSHIRKAYMIAGEIYTIKAQARCATDTSIVSEWSSGLTHTVSSYCQMFNLTKRISGETDNSLNSSDMNIIIGYVNSHRSVPTVFAVTPGQGYDPRYDFNGDGSVNFSDLNMMISYVNAGRMNTAVFARLCPAAP